MKELLTYLAETSICSGVLFAVYAALLERRTPFRWCRAYLLATVFAALVIPALRIPVWPAPVVAVSPVVAAGFSDAAAVVPVVEATSVDWGAVVFWAVYGLGVAVVLVPVLRQLLSLRRIRRTGRIHFADDYTLVRTADRIEACSLFRTVYVWQGTPDDELPVILLHERSHIRHRHSAERIAMELMKALTWWNPFVWLAASRLNEVEEFEADGDVLRSGCDLRYYMQLILKQLLGYSPDITNGLRNSRTKKRFIMMTTHNPHKHGLLRLAGTVPALLGLLCAFSFTSRAAQSAVPEPETAIAETAGQPEEAFFRVETMPVFRCGGLDDFRQWVQLQVRMPEEARKRNLQGRVVATFTIEKDGTLGDIRIVQTPDRVFSEEVERVLKRSEKWTPGMQDGKAVRVKYTLPVDFRLAGMEAPAQQGAAPAASPTTVEKITVVSYPTQAAARPVTVQVTVTEKGVPLSGVLVVEEGSTNGTVTDSHGRAEVKTYTGRTLRALYPAKDMECFTFTVAEDAKKTVKFGYDLLPDESATESADGSVTVSGHGTDAEKPMLVVDGEQFWGTLGDLDAKEIESVSVLKADGENKIVVTTKKGAAAKRAKN
ncbi:MAG: TonB family protein [Alistipes senegalensis]|nr:TonB family protein [Bacteroides cellulosilyticus]MCM1351596.1 TonB family protein [Alistipes senegalensis]